MQPTIYDLRLKLIELVRAGLLPRDEYDSLFEVLCEAKHFMPQYAADVDRAVQLLDRLLPAPEETRQRVYLVGPPATLGAVMAQHLANMKGIRAGFRELASQVELVGLALLDTDRPVVQREEFLLEQEKQRLTRMVNVGHLDYVQREPEPCDVRLPRNFFSLELGRHPLHVLDSIQVDLTPVPAPLPFRQGHICLDFDEGRGKQPKQLKQPKQPGYQGYMNARHRRGKKY